MLGILSPKVNVAFDVKASYAKYVIYLSVNKAGYMVAYSKAVKNYV